MPTAQVLTAIEGEFSPLSSDELEILLLRKPPSMRDPHAFFCREEMATNLPHPLPPPCTSAAERLGHSTVKSSVYFEYLNYVFVISHSELTSYNPYTDAFFVSLKSHIKYYGIILNAEFDFI